MPWAILANIASRTPAPLTTATALWQGDVMATWVVLLRGVNVGGATNKLAMGDLRALIAVAKLIELPSS